MLGKLLEIFGLWKNIEQIQQLKKYFLTRQQLAHAVHYMSRHTQKVFADKQGCPGNRAPLVQRGSV